MSRDRQRRCAAAFLKTTWLAVCFLSRSLAGYCALAKPASKGLSTFLLEAKEKRFGLVLAVSRVTVRLQAHGGCLARQAGRVLRLGELPARTGLLVS
jgi:hypothetical protein